jgi:pyruvate/2-oxoglutarate dehydrogenase complex dihydrolipoamide dehydrogenase (E3) component
MTKRYDFIAIGGGSAGYNGAREAGKYAKKVAVVDGAAELGGLCILRGCMPSKTLIYSAEVLHLAQKAKLFGLNIPQAEVDMPALHRRKRAIIADFASYRVKGLESGDFDLYRSFAKFVGPDAIELADGTRLEADRFLIATGSQVSFPAIKGLDQIPVWTSDDALDLDFLPKSVLVLGGGVVACELAQYLRRIGSEVIQIQRSACLLSAMPQRAAMVVEQAFRDEGIDLFTGTDLLELRQTADGGIEAIFRHEGEMKTRRADHCLNALGRVPSTSGLNLAIAGVECSNQGQVYTHRFQQTSNPRIYAAGDCSGPFEIVHVAIQQAIVAVRHAFGEVVDPVDYSKVLSVVFTDPQLATVGLSETEALEAKCDVICASYPFDDHGKSILMEARYGFVKVIAERPTGRIVGAEIVGKDAGELIHCFAVAMAMNGTVHDMLKASWYHPTLAEILTYPLEEIAEGLSMQR